MRATRGSPPYLSGSEAGSRTGGSCTRTSSGVPASPLSRVTVAIRVSSVLHSGLVRTSPNVSIGPATAAAVVSWPSASWLISPALEQEDPSVRDRSTFSQSSPASRALLTLAPTWRVEPGAVRRTR